jgi:hypothetical protein
MLELILSAATASLMLCSAAYAGMPPASSQLSSSGLVQIKHQGGDDRFRAFAGSAKINQRPCSAAMQHEIARPRCSRRGPW